MNQYELIGSKYNITKQQPWRKYIEEYTLNKIIGDLNNKKILDLACGDGFYTNKFNKQNPKKLIGVDISKEMIKLALDKDTCIPYIVCDVMNLNLNEKFDIITGIYLLNYAKSEEELDKFVKVIKKHLDDDGTFIGINCSTTRDVSDYKKYGFKKIVNDNNTIEWTYYDNDNDIICKFNNYYLSNKIYERVFTQNSLKLTWMYPYLDPTQNSSYWQNFFDNSPIVFMIVNHKPHRERYEERYIGADTIDFAIVTSFQ